MIANIFIPIIFLISVVVYVAAKNKYLKYISFSIIVLFVVFAGLLMCQMYSMVIPTQSTGQELEKQFSYTLERLGISAPFEVEKGYSSGGFGESNYYFLLKERTDLDAIILKMVKQLKDKKNAEGRNVFDIEVEEMQLLSREEYDKFAMNAKSWNGVEDDLDAYIKIGVYSELFRSVDGRWSMFIHIP